MSTTEIDPEYVRMMGEEIRARLFPVPKADGRVPIPLPVAINYRPIDEEIGSEVLFIPVRAVQWVGISLSEAEEIEETDVRVFWAGTDYGAISFVFGEKPEVPEILEEEIMAPRLALLYAVAGVL